MKKRKWLGILLAMLLFSACCLPVVAAYDFPKVDFAIPTLTGIQVTFDSGDKYIVDYTGDSKTGIFFKEEVDENGFEYIELHKGANAINKKLVAERIKANPDSKLAKLAGTKDAGNVYFVSTCKKLKTGKTLQNSAQGTVAYEKNTCQVFLIAGERYTKGELYVKSALESVMGEFEAKETSKK